MAPRPPEKLLQASRFVVERVWQKLPDGSVRGREVVRHPGSVVIVPRLNDGRICLIRNYRIAVDETLIELPAGTLEPEEDPQACAFRELQEETGFSASSMTYLMSFFAAPGTFDEKMNLFVATDLQPGPPAREPSEQIDNLIVTWPEAIEMIRTNEIRDAKTIVGLMRFGMWLDDQGQ